MTFHGNTHFGNVYSGLVSDREAMDNGMRLFYVAITRAKKVLDLTRCPLISDMQIEDEVSS